MFVVNTCLAPPGNIHDLIVNYVTEVSVSLSWLPLQCHLYFTDETYYTIGYTPVFDEEEGTKYITVKSARTEITGLLPIADYKFFVLQSETGSILLSNVQQTTTLPPTSKCI